MIMHSIDEEVRREYRSSIFGRQFDTMADVAASLQTVLQNNLISNATIPIVAHFKQRGEDFAVQIESYVDQGPLDPMTAIWGRVPLQRLVEYFILNYSRSPDDEYFDLGTPVYVAAASSTYNQTCNQLFPKVADPPATNSSSPATVAAAVVDMGVSATRAPRDYSGKLHHVVTQNVDLSAHAEQVLSILLQRLDSKNVISQAAISCALVVPPGANINPTRDCFDQACSPEILAAVNAIELRLTADGLPSVVNLSLGTHVGPHNGLSPVEKYICNTLSTSSRFVVAAAGNDGLYGRAAKRSLTANEEDYISLLTGTQCEEVLVEIWWKSSASQTIDFSVEVFEISSSGGTTHHATLQLDPNAAGITLTQASAAIPNTITHSLFQANCLQGFSCAAFAMTSQKGTKLPRMQLEITVKSSTDTILNSWIVVCEKESPLTLFVQGGPDGTVTVPATDPRVLSVAGVRASGRLWEGSSRGPAFEYEATSTATDSPMMAHRPDLGTHFGTSFASPRACADALATLAQTAATCTDAKSLLAATYSPTRPLPQWDKRFGYHKQTS